MRYLVLILLMSLLMNCSKSYSVQEKNGVRHFSNSIGKVKSSKLVVIDQNNYSDTELIFRGTLQKKSGQLVIIINDKKQNKVYLKSYDGQLKELASIQLKEGRGPGEFSGWVPFIGFNDDDIMVLDGGKRSLELFAQDLKHKDSLLLNGNFTLYRSPSYVAFLPDGYVFSPSVPYYMVRTDNQGEMINGIMTELKTSTEKEREQLYEYNANIIKQDDALVYMAFTEGEDRYEIRAYDFTLKPVFTIKNADPLNKLLCARQEKIPDGLPQPVGTMTVGDLLVDDDYIYVLRATGGFAEYSPSDKKIIYKEIPGVKNPFIDVFDKKTGRFNRRLEIPFLETLHEITIFKQQEHFYLIVQAYYNDDDTIKKGSNTIYICKEDK